MINMIKNFFANIANSVKYVGKNKWIVKHNIDMLGNCYKYDTETSTKYIRVVAIDNNEENNKFIGLTFSVPKNIVNDDESVLMTNKYGPYVISDKYPNYSDISIVFNILSIKDLNNCEKIDKDEFTTQLTYTMDALLAIGY